MICERTNYNSLWFSVMLEMEKKSAVFLRWAIFIDNLQSRFTWYRQSSSHKSNILVGTGRGRKTENSHKQSHGQPRVQGGVRSRPPWRSDTGGRGTCHSLDMWAELYYTGQSMNASLTPRTDLGRLHQSALSLQSCGWSLLMPHQWTGVMLKYEYLVIICDQLTAFSSS